MTHDPDWRRAEEYAYTASLTRPEWAWEFLRRNAAFCAAFDGLADRRGVDEHLSVQPDLIRWGICFRSVAARGFPRRSRSVGSKRECACPAALDPQSVSLRSDADGKPGR